MERTDPGWWTRNWKWALPSGCLLLVLLAFGGCVALVAGAFGIIRNTGPYADALARAQRSEAVVAALGEPVEAGWWMSGNYNDTGSSGSADYSVPLSGPRGRGTLYVEASKHAGRWRFDVLVVVPENGEPIDLRTDDEQGAEAAPEPDDDTRARVDA